MSDVVNRALEGVDLEQSVAEATGVQNPTPDTEGASAPGTGTAEPQPDPQPAEALKADTGSGGPSETVPYTRFKEVNDQLRTYKTLEDEHGYDADSLRQLAEWADRFDQDPVQSWLSVAAQMEDLPPTVAVAVQAALGQQAASQPSPGQAPQTNSDEEPPPWANELIAKVDQMEQTEVQKTRDQQLDEVLAWWETEDKRQGVRTPSREVKLTYLSGASATASDVEDMKQRARAEYLEEREAILQGSIVQPGTEPPSSVPGGAAPVKEPPPKPKSFREASRMVEEDVRAGRLNTQ
jgi:hypothetical protein